MNELPSVELRRRIDFVIYRFHPCNMMKAKPSWKREDAEVWMTWIEQFGWVCVDRESNIVGVPWGAVLNRKTSLPPEGEWVSKKGDKSYVYDLVYLK
ncbi:MAG: hypothetical protein COV52_00890 [Gammaproteobacteria bacterium CG11_big_fil_rev_8_21_14_0_20_46_22]|nr:MAG: hypothetical protein COV52_00890 [Gammaproteobacteria bacterium CG11_big_fil_rev_8_21_14_0_20_46_22]